MFALQFRICLQIPSDPFNGSILVLFRDVLIGGHLQSTVLYCTATTKHIPVTVHCKVLPFC